MSLTSLNFSTTFAQCDAFFNTDIELPSSRCVVTQNENPSSFDLRLRPTASVYMTGLEKGTSYRFGIRAYNSIGQANSYGVQTSLNNIDSITKTTPPSAPPGIPFTTLPQSTYLTLHYNVPIDDGGTPIIGYRIYINKEGMTDIHEEFVSNTSALYGASRNIIIRNLNASSYYTFQVAGK